MELYDESQVPTRSDEPRRVSLFDESALQPMTPPRPPAMARVPSGSIEINMADLVAVEDVALLKSQCESMIEATLRKDASAWEGTRQMFDDPRHWKVHVTKPNVTVYRRRSGEQRRRAEGGGGGGSMAARQFIACGRLRNVSLEDLVYGCYADTTADERIATAAQFQELFLDATVDHVFERCQDDDGFHFFGIKSLVCVSPVDMLIAPREFVYVEYSKTAVTSQGYSVLVRALTPVPLSLLPLLSRKPASLMIKGLIRASGMYRYDEKTDAVQVFMEGSVNPGGKVFHGLGHLYLSRFVPRLVDREHCATVKYMQQNQIGCHVGGAKNITAHALAQLQLHSSATSNSQGQQHPSQLTARQQKSVCFVCVRTFRLLKRQRYSCRMCREVVCRQCIVFLAFYEASPVKVITDGMNVTQKHFCIECIRFLRATRVGTANQRDAAGNHVNPFRQDFDDGLDDDEDGELDMEHTERILKLKQLHLEQDKLKNLPPKVRLFDETDDIALGGSSSDGSWSSPIQHDMQTAKQNPTPVAEMLLQRTDSKETPPSDQSQQRRSLVEQLQQVERSIARQTELLQFIRESRMPSSRFSDLKSSTDTGLIIPPTRRFSAPGA